MNLTPTLRTLWHRYQAANRRARLAYWREHHCPECGVITGRALFSSDAMTCEKCGGKK